MIIRLQHVGLAIENLEAFSERWDQLLGLRPGELRRNQGKGFQFDARIMFPNQCWLHVVQNWNPESRVNRFLRSQGEGLEHLAFETDDIEADVARLRELGVPIFQDTIFNAADGFEAFVYPGDAIGFTVELIQPHTSSWNFNASNLTNNNVGGLQHIGVAVGDVRKAAERLEMLFGLVADDLRTDQHHGDQLDMKVDMGNDRLWLHLVQPTVQNHRVSTFLNQYGEGLEHLCIEVADIRKAVYLPKTAGFALEQSKIYLDRPDGFEAFLEAKDTYGVTIELIEPYPTSRGYRQNGQ